MTDYRRIFLPGGCYFFTVVTQDRRPLFGDADNVERLREGFRRVMAAHPFAIDVVVIMPDHVHTVSGVYPMGMLITRYAGVKSNISSVSWRQAWGVRLCPGNERRVSGSVVIGGMQYVMKRIGNDMWTTCISIR
jgi:REP element-mobilizing transposase RayT